VMLDTAEYEECEGLVTLTRRRLRALGTRGEQE